jgi:GT2 family glycosyltransferase
MPGQKHPLPTLSVVIPSWNGRHHLEGCLPSLRRHAPPGTQVIVVDDGSTDGTLDWLRREHPWVERVQTPANLGFCGAVNLGLQQATGEIVELLNNDTVVLPGWAEAALPHFRDPSVGSVAPLTLRLDAPDIVDSAGQEYHLIGWARNIGYGRPLDAELSRPREVFGPSGCSGFYRRELLLRLGGLAEPYGAYFEDTDLAFRLRWAGYRCLYEPASRVLHRGSASYGTMPDRLVRLISRNEELVFWSNLPGRLLLAGLLPHLAFQMLRSVRQAQSGRLAAYVRGKLDALTLVPWILQRRRMLRRLHAAGPPPRLAIATSAQVLRQGWVWLRYRRCA